MPKTDLKKISTLPPKGTGKEACKLKTQEILAQLDDYQNLLYAEGKHAVLVVLQGMDAAGKDGLIRNVFTSMNPQGIMVHSFKVPTQEELEHDFLWRIHKQTPGKGMIQIFNRSHYEDILVVRVHGLITDRVAQQRIESINHFEKMLTEQNNTHILKFYLHVSAKEQEQRLKERMVDERKMWKYNANDFSEAKLRKEYIKYYNEVFDKCNEIPWTIVPSDKNWYKEYVIAKALLDLFQSLNMKYPVLKVGNK